MDALKSALYERGADLVSYVDISELSPQQTQGYDKAIVFFMALSKQFIGEVHSGTPIPEELDDYLIKDQLVNELAEWVAVYIQKRGYRAYAQSELNNLQSGHYEIETKTSTLPHKTIARHAGLGFIGKNNLLITEAYGCAFCMCTVLTDAPLLVEENFSLASKCGNCNVCSNICPPKALHGNRWTETSHREDIVDVFKCRCALKCMINCPWTLRYAGISNRK